MHHHPSRNQWLNKVDSYVICHIVENVVRSLIFQKYTGVHACLEEDSFDLARVNDERELIWRMLSRVWLKWLFMMNI